MQAYDAILTAYASVTPLRSSDADRVLQAMEQLPAQRRLVQRRPPFSRISYQDYHMVPSLRLPG